MKILFLQRLYVTILSFDYDLHDNLQRLYVTFAYFPALLINLNACQGNHT